MFGNLLELIAGCGIRELKCETLKQCYPIMKRCDGVPDCLDGSDEKDCTKDSMTVSTVYNTHQYFKCFLFKC